MANATPVIHTTVGGIRYDDAYRLFTGGVFCRTGRRMCNPEDCACAKQEEEERKKKHAKTS